MRRALPLGTSILGLCMVLLRPVHGSTVPCRNSLGTKMRFSSAIYHHWRYKIEKRTAISGKSIMTTLVAPLAQIGNVWKVRMISATNRPYEPNHHCFRGCAPALVCTICCKSASSESKYSARAGSADKAQFTEFLRSQGWPFARNRIIIDGCERTS